MSLRFQRLLRRRWLHYTGLLLALLCAETRAHAQEDNSSGGSEQAGAHFDRGVRFYEEGDYRAALLEFQRAYALQHAYQLLYNLGQVSGELRDYAAAEDYFKRYLVDGKDAIPSDRRAEVLVELSHMATRVGSLRITSNVSGAEIHIDDKAVPEALTKPVRVSAGRREVVAEKAGYTPVRRAVDVLGGEEVTLSVVFGPALAQQPTAASKSSSSVLPWVTGIGSAALLIGGSIMAYASYSDATAYADELDRFTTQAELDRLSSRTQSKALAADIMLGCGLVGAAVTVVLILTSDSGETPPKVKASSRGAQFQF
ncbi:MAG TPA: PEGA domain-containing protein [Polyangiales bacterium]|nr:PEGA domain-containing protein [Polyangiales bacterium]